MRKSTTWYLKSLHRLSRILSWNKFHSRAKDLEDSAVNKISSPAGKLFHWILRTLKKLRTLPHPARTGRNPLIYLAEFQLHGITIEAWKRTNRARVYHSQLAPFTPFRSVELRWTCRTLWAWLIQVLNPVRREYVPHFPWKSNNFAREMSMTATQRDPNLEKNEAFPPPKMKFIISVLQFPIFSSWQ